MCGIRSTIRTSSFAVQEEQYEKALDYLARAIKENGLPPEEQMRTMFQVGQIQVMFDNMPSALPMAKEGKIRAVAQAEGVDLSGCEIVNTEHSHAAAEQAVAMARAAEVAPDPTLRRFLSSRAKALAGDSPFPYDESDYDWIALKGDWDRAKRFHYRLLPLSNSMFLETNPIPVKAALAIMGAIRETKIRHGLDPDLD